MPGLQTRNLPTRPWRTTIDQFPEVMDLSAGQRAGLEVALLGDGGAKHRRDLTIARKLRREPGNDRIRLSSRFELQSCNSSRTR
jgi:hypothetical protein